MSLLRYRTRRRLRRLVIAAVAVAAVGTGGFAAVPFVVQAGVPLPEITDQGGGQASVILAADGTVLATVAPRLRHLTLDAVPETLAHATIAIEDQRFAQHYGVDPVGIARALVANLRNGTTVEGGSTITQQLVKLTVTGDARTLERKAREAAYAIRLERAMSKDEILHAYLDTAWFNSGGRGAATAAQAWFGKSVGALTPAEAATIAGALQAPARFDPRRHPDAATARRDQVLRLMHDQGYLTGGELDTALATPIRLVDEVDEPSLVTDYPWVHDTVRRELAELGYNLTDGDLVVRTGIVVDLQDAAQETISTMVPDGVGGALAVVEPGTGHIQAIVGGRDFAASQVNAALGEAGGGSGRQAGSTFKMLALAAAVENGVTPDDRLDAPASLMVGTKPVKNYDGKNWGRITVQTATRWSINTAYMNLTKQVGIDEVERIARRLGMTRLGSEHDERLAIGQYETSPVELAATYATIANGGVWVAPHIVTSIRQAERTLYSAEPDRVRAVSTATAETVTALLIDVVRNGTGTRARTAWETAGKTGTTDNSADAWFAGFISGHAAAVWIGNMTSNDTLVLPRWGRVAGGGLPATMFNRTLTDGLGDIDLPRLLADAPPTATVEVTPETSPTSTPTPTTTLAPLPIPPTSTATTSPSPSPSASPAVSGTPETTPSTSPAP